MDGENGKQGQGRAARLLLDSLDGYADPFVLCDPDDRVLYTNARYHELFPAAPPQGEIRGWGFEALLRRVLAGGETPDPGIPDPEEFIRLRLAQRAALAGRSLSEATIGGRLFRRVEERTPNGCVITSYSDITDLKQAQEAAERNAARLAAAVEAIPGGFMMMDEGLNYLVWNSRYPGIGGTTDAVIRSHGNVRETLWLQARRGDYDDLRLDPGAFTAGQVADTPCLATLLRCQAARPPGQRPTEEEMEAQVEWHLLRFRPGGRVDGDNAERDGTFRVAGSGAVIEFRRTYTPGLGWVSLYTDVTERMRQAEETAAARAAAERALADLRAAQASLVQAEKLASLGGLVAGIAHELNTPIGITYTAATHLKDQAARFRARLEGGQLRRAELDEFLDLVAEGAALLEANAGRASQLVQSFKNVSADRTHDERRRFELGPALEELVVSLGPRWRKAGHVLSLDCPPGLEMDGYPGALGQVVTNLVVNSTVHAYAPGRSGKLSLVVRRGEPGEVEITYADDGRGMSATHLPRVFEPFFTTRRGTGGTGLGLHIVYNIVTKTLGGRIEVASRLGHGTRFTLTLPLVAPVPTASGEG